MRSAEFRQNAKFERAAIARRPLRRGLRVWEFLRGCSAPLFEAGNPRLHFASARQVGARTSRREHLASFKKFCVLESAHVEAE